ncbi:MAG: helix-turn-helix domain-containing protein [archaeon GB-1867-005]|nr:helix-turn-helix domain-containing protein [Candidatus Culexmicrobium cathedralense]
MKPRCEEISRVIVPSIRALIAKILIEKFNFTQIQAAKALGVSQAAISYYLRSKRGKKAIEAISKCNAIRKIEEIAQEIANGNLREEAEEIFCKVCREVVKEIDVNQLI